MKSHPVFQLPPHRIGPYLMRAVPATRRHFVDKRRKVESFWTSGLVLIDQSLDAEATLRYFLRYLVTAIHYRSGLNDRSDEESYTHSLASGLVELAWNNPDFWAQFQAVLDAQLKPADPWQLTAWGLLPPQVHAAPQEVHYRGRTCPIEWVPHDDCARESCYGFFFTEQCRIELSELLSGGNLPLIALHEVIHFLHNTEGLGDRSKEREFVRTQVSMLLRFWKENPQFWHWWLGQVRLAATRAVKSPPVASLRELPQSAVLV